MKLEGKRIILRPYRKSDANDLAEKINHKDIARYTTNIPYPYSLEDAKKFIKSLQEKAKKKQPCCFGIFLRENKEFIGGIGIHNINFKNKNAETGYWLNKDYRGNGYAKEALELVLDYAFKKLKLRRVYAKVMTPNKPSYKLLEKVGFKKEGTLRKEIEKNKKTLDVYIYGLLKEEF